MSAGWEGSTDTGPLLFRQVPEAELVSVTAKISAQTAGFWSRTGVIVRAPNAIDNATMQENWVTSSGWRVNFTDLLRHRSQMSTAGAEMMLDDRVFTPEDLTYLRLDRVGPGQFRAFRGTGLDDNNISWTPHPGGPQTNANLAGINLQVGVQAGSGPTGGAGTAIFDWVQIQTTSQTYRDDFTYTHDFSTGVPGFNPTATSGGAIWSGVENANAGGVTTNAGSFTCTACTWSRNGSGDFNDGINWDPQVVLGPSGNTVSVVLGGAAAAAATVYTNKNVVLKQIDFDNDTPYVLGGTGSITLDADTGNALINVLQGSHQIQANVILNDNVTVTTATGTTLNVNAAVNLNNHTWTNAGDGTVNCNNNPSCFVSVGSGALVNEGNLQGLVNLDADFAQSAVGSLAVSVGGAPIQVSGGAQLAGVLDVSLAEGFVPAPGAAYTVLTADSVTDLGLSLTGEAADLFRLAVGGNSISLVTSSIPEPGTMLMVAISGAVASLACRRRSPREGRTPRRAMSGSAVPRFTLFSAGALLSLIVTFSATAQTVVGVRRDDFNTTWDYTTGTVPPGSIWNGIHNPTAGGMGAPPGCTENAACFVSNGVDFTGAMHTGQLYVEDLLNSNIGWEADQPDYNNAPFLHTDFSGTASAQYDFDAVVKIDSQVAGAWSYAGIIARVAGPPVGIAPGSGTAFTAAENFVTAGTFRTADATPENGNILVQNVVEGAGANLADLFVDLAPDGAAGAIPVWLRLKKRGAVFSVDSSTDGTTWFEETPNSVTNQALNTPGQTLEVGVSYMAFNTSSIEGSADFDFFELTLYESAAPTAGVWNVARGGDWNLASNWQTTPAGNVPNQNTINVTFGQSTSGPATVFTNSAVKAKSLTFDNDDQYAISGAGTITLEADAGTPSIQVNAGSHEIQVGIAIASNATITAAPGTRLDFNNQFDHVAPNRAVAISGGGKVNFNNNINLPINGAVNVNSGGVFGGNGRVNGVLNNNAGGTVAPGTSAGTLTVDANYVQNASAALAIEIGGTAPGTFDRLMVGGLASLNGALNVSLINGFTPQASDMFQIVTAGGNLLGTFNNTPGGVLTTSAGTFNVTYMGGANGFVRLSNFMPAAGGITGDFNNNGVVDAADYVLWRNGGMLENDPTPGNDPADYNVWRMNFGRSSGGSAASLAATVPEPAASTLALVMFIGACSMWPSPRR
jgi:hypothetical protein